MKNGKVMVFSILLSLCMIGPAMAWNLYGTLEEWGTSPFRPYDITVLSDGSPWLTYHDELAADWPVGKVCTIDPSDGSVTTYQVPWGNSGFETLDRGLDDTLWIADREDRIVNFDPTTHVFTAYPLPAATFTLPAGPFGINVASDGKVWFTCMTSNALGCYNPVTNTWQNFPVMDGGNSGKPVDIAFSSDGTVWFTTKSGGAIRGLGSLVPSTGTVTLRTIDGGVDPFGIAVAGDKIWFLDHHRTVNGTLVRYDMGTGVFTYFSGIPELQDPHFLVIDPDGLIWMTAFGASAIGTFNPFTLTFQSRAVTANSGPMGIFLVPSGEIWWAETFETEHGGAGRITQPPPPDVPVPTMTGWGIVILSSITAGFALWAMRRKKLMG